MKTPEITSLHAYQLVKVLGGFADGFAQHFVLHGRLRQMQLQLQHVSLKEQPILRISAFAEKKKLTALKFSKMNSQNLEQMLRMVLIS